jgi:hypothetical protein
LQPTVGPGTHTPLLHLPIEQASASSVTLSIARGAPRRRPTCRSRRGASGQAGLAATVMRARAVSDGVLRPANHAI